MSEALPLKTTMNFEYGQARELRPGLRRIVANNPSPFTFKGTNSYLVGTDELALIDPGPGDPAHLEAILRAAGKAPIKHILLTHTHHDHYEGLPALQARTGAKTAGYGYAPKTRISGAHAASPNAAARGEIVDSSFAPDIVLKDGGKVEGKGYDFEALFTPGHAPDHLCFALLGTPVLFSGDHVMSWNTSVVAPPEGSMADYMRSLEKLVDRKDEVYLPGHGGTLRSPQKVVRAFIIHRKMRESAILQAVRDGHTTIPRIVDVVYRGLDSRLVNAARASAFAHVQRMVEIGQLECPAGPPSLDRELVAAKASS
jgi:glyoxylase-like metal-dependent hydrolase (beta-lactamase superfamily II)